MGFFSLAQQSHQRARTILVLCMMMSVMMMGCLNMPSVAYAASSTPTITVNAVTATITPDGTLRYKITITNDLDSSADLKRTDVVFHYDPNTLMIVTSAFDNSDDFVSKVDNGNVTVQFGTIDNGDTRSAYLVFHVNPNVGIGAPIQADVSYTWTSTKSTGNDGFDVANVTVVSTPTVSTATITPSSGAAGTTFQIVASGLGDKEQVVTWLNMPDGSAQSVGVSGTTDSLGMITLTYTATSLAPGAYSLVVHGIDSGQQYVVLFTITA